jgi:hypothetical protein
MIMDLTNPLARCLVNKAGYGLPVDDDSPRRLLSGMTPTRPLVKTGWS